MNCQSVRDNIKAYIDCELGILARWSIARHLNKCPYCRLEKEKIMELTDSLRNARGLPVPEELRSAVLSNIFADTITPVKSKRFRPSAALAGAAAVFLITAIVFPVFMYKESIRMRSVQKSVEYNRDMRLSAKPESTGAAPGPVPSAAAPEKPSVELKRDKASSLNASTVQPARDAHPPTSLDALTRRIYTPNAVTGKPAKQLIIVRTADLSLEVKRFQPAYDSVIAIAKSVGGYVSDSSAKAEETVPVSGMITLWVPELRFDRTVERLSVLGVVKSRKISGRDVTEEVVNLESSLRNRQAEERQYLAVMDKARKVNDIITVSNELYRVRSEIEKIQGRLKYLRTSAAMPTITVNLNENENSKPLPKDEKR